MQLVYVLTKSDKTTVYGTSQISRGTKPCRPILYRIW